ncbi:unnamed protein product [Closterium sp. Yama58-4]|nr:unnamed protein product [Closterium sp. Yama58-4]
MIFTIPETFRYPIGAKKVPKSKYRTRRELEGWLESLIRLTPPSKRRRLAAKDEYAAGCLSVQKASLVVKDEPANETDCATYCSSSPEGSSVKFSDEDVALWSFVEATCNGRTRIAFFKRLIYEKDLNPRASLQWFENSRDLNVHYGVEVADAHEYELFFTSHSDTVPIEAVKRVVTVLSQAHFAERSASLLSREKSSCFMCYRKVDGSKIRRVRIESFQGYYSQSILVQACCDEAAEVLESRNDKLSRRLTKPRTQRVPKQKLLACLNSPGVKCSSMQSFNLPESDMDADEADGRVEDEGQNQPGEPARTEKKEIWDAFVGSMVEVLNDDVSRLCWRPAEVVCSRPLEVKVRYFTSKSNSAEVKEEWVLLRQLGGADKYGFRHSHRNCVRPYQLHNCDGSLFEDGELVDVRWCDRWWEGIAVHSWTNGFVAVHLLGPGSIKFVHKKFLRQSREWVRGQWEALNSQKPFANQAASMHLDPELKNLSEFPPRAIAGPDTLNNTRISPSLGYLQYLREIVLEALAREQSCDSEQAHGVDLVWVTRSLNKRGKSTAHARQKGACHQTWQQTITLQRRPL